MGGLKLLVYIIRKIGQGLFHAGELLNGFNSMWVPFERGIWLEEFTVQIELFKIHSAFALFQGRGSMRGRKAMVSLLNSLKN